MAEPRSLHRSTLDASDSIREPLGTTHGGFSFLDSGRSATGQNPVGIDEAGN